MIHGIISVVILIVVTLLCTEFRKWMIKRKLHHFESPKQWPILGACNRFFGKSNDEIIDVVLDVYKEVKSTPFQLWFGPVLVVFISEPEDCQIILTSEDCLNKPFLYDQLKCKTSIIATDKEIWRPNRRAMNTAFNVRMLQSYVPILNDKSRILIKQMEPHLNKNIDLYRIIFICMIDMVTRTTMGCEMNLQSDRGAFFYNIVKTVMNNLQYRITRIWLKWDFTYSLTKVYRDEFNLVQNGNNFLKEIYDKKVDELEYLKAHGIDYLKEAKENNSTNMLEKCLLLENDGIFSRENVMDQMRVIILAGIDTSSITLFGTLLMLAIHQKHQDLVLEELRTVFETSDCDVNQTHLANMRYTERVIKESQRLLCPVPFIGRKATADIKLSKGTVPKGTMVIINIMHMHRNPRIWTNPLEFDPDRFLPENIAKRPPFSYIPFSAGPRNCIGMRYAMISAKITLAHLLRQFKFTTDLRMEDIRMKLHLVLEVTNENPVRIERRLF